MTDYHYEGEELQLFEKAGKWKQYLGKTLGPFIQGQVLEVGAGIGETTAYLQNKRVTGWTCLEPDKSLLKTLEKKIALKNLPSYCQAQAGTVKSLRAEQVFDTIIYIDVLEHIRDDRSEIEMVSPLLKAGGCLIILSPAHSVLYNPFDKAIGHYRRYSKKTLRALIPSSELKEEKIFYLDSASMLLLLLNKVFLRKKYPSVRDLWIWQTFFLPVSKVMDQFFFHVAGKSIIGIWKKRSAGK